MKGFRPYAAAVAASAVAVGVSLLLPDSIQRYTSPELFLGAIAVSSWYGGLPAGLVATALCGGAGLWFVLPPFVAERVATPSGVIQLAVFVLLAALINLLRGTLAAATRRAEASTLAAQVEQLRLSFLAEASDLLASSLDHEAGLRAVAHLAVPFLADLCVVDLLDPEGRVRRLAIEHVDPAIERFARELDARHATAAGEEHPLLRVLRDGRPMLRSEVTDSELERVMTDPAQLAGYRRLGVRSALVVPLIARGRTLGAISLMISESKRRYGAADLALAEDLARRCAVAVDNAQLYRAAQDEIVVRRRAEQRLAVQYAITRVLAERATLEEAAPHVLRTLCECLGWVYGGLWRVDPVDDVLRCVETWHLADADVSEFEAASRRTTFARGIGLPGRVWSRPEPTWIQDVVVDTNFPRAPVAARQGLHGAIAFPIRVGREVVAVLEFFSSSILPPDEELLAMMGTIGTQIGQFIERRRVEEERARLLRRVQAAHADTQIAERRSALLAEASRVLAASLDHTTTLASLAGLCVAFLADWCLVDLIDEGGTEGRVASAPADADERLQILLDNHPPAAAARAAAAAHGRSTLLASIEGFRVGSLMLVPLVARGRVLGVMALAAAVPARYGQGDLALAEDLAYRAALAVDNARLYHEAQDAGRRKDEFLAMLGHELRNPLGAIRSAVEVLDRISSQSEGAVRQRAIIDRQTRHLHRLVDDLLDVSRVVTGKISLQSEPIDLRRLADRCWQALRTRFAERQQSVTLTQPDDPVVVRGDQVRLEQVVCNLLDNAAKYTRPGGHIAVTVEAVGNEATLRVRDDGIGMAPELVPRVFELFTQADGSLARTQGGLGLGLTLVRRLVEQHGGSASASSEGPGHGSEFVVRLPLCTEEAPAAVAAPPPSTPTPALHILIIEDNPDGREALRTLLEIFGHRVEVAADGPSGLELARRARPEVALVDIGLPGLDGYQVAAALRGELGSIRLVALTGYGQPEDRSRALRAGFDDHLVKPVEAEDLMRVLAPPAPPASARPSP